MGTIIGNYRRGTATEIQNLKIEYSISEPWVQGNKTYVDIKATLSIKRDKHYDHVRDTRKNKYWHLALVEWNGSNWTELSHSGNKNSSQKEPQTVLASKYMPITELSYRHSWNNNVGQSIINFQASYNYYPGFSAKLSHMVIPLDGESNGYDYIDYNNEIKADGFTIKTPITKLKNPSILRVSPSCISYNNNVTISWNTINNAINNNVKQYAIYWQKDIIPSLNNYYDMIIVDKSKNSVNIQLKEISPGSNVYFGVRAIGTTANQTFWSDLSTSTNHKVLINTPPKMEITGTNISNNTIQISSLEQTVSIILKSTKPVNFYKKINGSFKQININEKVTEIEDKIEISENESSINQINKIEYYCNDEIDSSKVQTLTIEQNFKPKILYANIDNINTLKAKNTIIKPAIELKINKQIKKNSYFTYKLTFFTKGEGEPKIISIKDIIQTDLLPEQDNFIYKYEFKDIRFYVKDITNISVFKIEVLFNDLIENSIEAPIKDGGQENFNFPVLPILKDIRNNINKSNTLTYLNFCQQLYFYFKDLEEFDTIEKIEYYTLKEVSSIDKIKENVGFLDFEDLKYIKENNLSRIEANFPISLLPGGNYSFNLRLKYQPTGFSYDFNISSWKKDNGIVNIRRVPELKNSNIIRNIRIYKPYSQFNNQLTISLPNESNQETFKQYKEDYSLTDFYLKLKVRNNIVDYNITKDANKIDNIHITSKDTFDIILPLGKEEDEGIYKNLIAATDFTFEDLNNINESTLILEIKNEFNISKTFNILYNKGDFKENIFYIDFREYMENNNLNPVQLYFRDTAVNMTDGKNTYYTKPVRDLKVQNLFLKENLDLFCKGEIQSYNYNYDEINKNYINCLLQVKRFNNSNNSLSVDFDKWVKYQTVLTFVEKDPKELPKPGCPKHFVINPNGANLTELKILHHINEINQQGGYEVAFSLLCFTNNTQTVFYFYNNYIDPGLDEPEKEKDLERTPVVRHSKGNIELVTLKMEQQTDKEVINGKAFFYDLGIDQRSREYSTFTVNTNIKIFLEYQRDDSDIYEESNENIFDEEKFDTEGQSKYVNFNASPSFININTNSNWNFKFLDAKVVITNCLIGYKNKVPYQCMRTIKTFYSNDLPLYNIVPLVSYRKGMLGINTKTIDNLADKDSIMTINQNAYHKMIYLRGMSRQDASVKETTIDLSSSQIDGFIIKNGSWDLPEQKDRFLTFSELEFESKLIHNDIVSYEDFYVLLKRYKGYDVLSISPSRTIITIDNFEKAHLTVGDKIYIAYQKSNEISGNYHIRNNKIISIKGNQITIETKIPDNVITLKTKLIKIPHSQKGA